MIFNLNPKNTKSYRMNITSVNYNRTYAIGPYLNEKIGVESTIEPGDNPIEVLKSLKELADSFNKAANPHLQDQLAPEPTILPEKQVEKQTEVEFISIENDIRSFTDYDKLGKVYGMLVKVQPQLAAVYDEIREKLKQAEIKSILDRTEAYVPVPNSVNKVRNSRQEKHSKTYSIGADGDL